VGHLRSGSIRHFADDAVAVALRAPRVLGSGVGGQPRPPVLAPIGALRLAARAAHAHRAAGRVGGANAVDLRALRPPPAAVSPRPRLRAGAALRIRGVGGRIVFDFGQHHAEGVLDSGGPQSPKPDRIYPSRPVRRRRRPPRQRIVVRFLAARRLRLDCLNIVVSRFDSGPRHLSVLPANRRICALARPLSAGLGGGFRRFESNWTFAISGDR
jgi:hypothetical protein